MITVSAFNWVPDFAKGLVRDLPVRWALEEAGLSYSAKLIGHPDKDTATYRDWQPFGQVPAFDDGKLRFFESGAIVLYIAEQSPVLLPDDPFQRRRAISWLFAALSTIDPVIRGFHLVEEAPAAREKVSGLLKSRLAALAAVLKNKEYLEDRFTVGDLMMGFVLRSLRDTDLVFGDTVLGPYLARLEARPAFARALSAQLGDFLAEPPV
ncbi:glutathione S-transferase [Rhizomicrobium palustre]|uniref:Glutathione S-transferase n=1 Tax=Rhizomicrobium palustre TaxID=189966 RepID=A0A846N462_9PROT|nr:glutathione S-transferase family protein [Rhizomicrobium palustre]NIK90413.1 glutathione S-transferase [Rhizomicrobium palustre]